MVDTQDLGPCGMINTVRVQVPLSVYNICSKYIKEIKWKNFHN